MQSIFPLPEHIITQIAAGEVIERPAYAIKELLENSLDAESSQIEIYLEEAGLKKIMIIDNGKGMSKEDVLECYKHHTTSKINKKSNLSSIKTLGFRGEAISSIASISKMTIKSRNAFENSGFVIELLKGKIVNRYSIGMPIGTSIIVENLFSSVPARKKFLKSRITEYRHILETIIPIMVANCKVGFKIINNGKIILNFNKQDDLIERINYLLGDDIFSNLIPINIENDSLVVKGFISKPNIASTTLKKQFIFVNNRFITDKRISHAVKQGYSTLLDSSSYPLFILFLLLPNEMVDVNVHPRKQNVAFLNDKSIYENITSSIYKTLNSGQLKHKSSAWENLTLNDSNMPKYATDKLRKTVYPWDLKNITKIQNISKIFQIHNLYIVSQTFNGLIFIDQHAAHERILYEQYFEYFETHKKAAEIIELKESLILRLSKMDNILIVENTDKFKDLGFKFEEYSDSMIKITHIPMIFKDHNIGKLITDLLSDFDDYKFSNLDTQSHKMISFLACRTAVKSGDNLTQKQCKDIVVQLEKTTNNLTCPHGRPTKTEFTLKDINKYFKR